MYKVFLFGAGNVTKIMLQKVPIKFFCDYLSREILGIIDNDVQKHNSVLYGFKILGPSILYESDWDFIVISSNYYDEIIKQLVDEMKLPSEKIVMVDKFIRDTFVQYQYNKLTVENQVKNLCYTKKFNPKSTVIYTAIRDNYDDLKEPLVVNNNFKYICFTNNKTLKSDVWEIRNADDYLDTEATPYWDRAFKILPHRYLAEYDTSVWIDGSMQIVGDISEYMNIYQKYTDILFVPHYERECVYEEAAACITLGKGKKEDIIRQMHFYFSEKYPYDNGLLCGGFMVRNHNVGYVSAIMEDWWEQFIRFSTRDQLSIPYVFWKKQCCFDVSNEYYNDNRWIKNFMHK